MDKGQSIMLEELEDCLKGGFKVIFEGFPPKVSLVKAGEVVGVGDSPKVALAQYETMQRIHAMSRS